VNDDEHSLFMTVRIGYWLRIMRGTKRLNPFFRLHEAIVRYSYSAQVSLLLFFYG